MHQFEYGPQRVHIRIRMNGFTYRLKVTDNDSEACAGSWTSFVSIVAERLSITAVKQYTMVRYANILITATQYPRQRYNSTDEASQKGKYDYCGTYNGL